MENFIFLCSVHQIKTFNITLIWVDFYTFFRNDRQFQIPNNGFNLINWAMDRKNRVLQRYNRVGGKFQLFNYFYFAYTGTFSFCFQTSIPGNLDEWTFFIQTIKFQSDSTERRFSQYRQMSGGRFLVFLREAINSKRILSIRAVAKADINF